MTLHDMTWHYMTLHDITLQYITYIHIYNYIIIYTLYVQYMAWYMCLRVLYTMLMRGGTRPCKTAVYFQIPVQEHHGPCPALVRANPHQNGKPMQRTNLRTKAKQKGSYRSPMSHHLHVGDDWTWDPDQRFVLQKYYVVEKRDKESSGWCAVKNCFVNSGEAPLLKRGFFTRTVFDGLQLSLTVFVWQYLTSKKF